MIEKKHYVILDCVRHDEFYDIAIVHFGFKKDTDENDLGIVLNIPVPKGINDDWIYYALEKEIDKMMEYIWKQNTQCT